MSRRLRYQVAVNLDGFIAGRDMWLFGGGALFRSLLDPDSSIPSAGTTTKLILSAQKTLPETSIVCLAYAVASSTAPAPRIDYIRPEAPAKKGSRAK